MKRTKHRLVLVSLNGDEIRWEVEIFESDSTASSAANDGRLGSAFDSSPKHRSSEDRIGRGALHQEISRALASRWCATLRGTRSLRVGTEARIGSERNRQRWRRR
ncbi:unnamed protein product [Linum trigynum]|uniref:Uncharacterized protein n=1 Tax=Linum trigynum TaxID=586398 RepID=A0AAV2D020_9ROSI